MASRPLLRAGGFAAVAMPVSLAGHLAAGAQAPDHATVLLGVALIVLAHRTVLGRRERSWPVITLALVSTQVCLHVLLACDAGAHVHALRSQATVTGLPTPAMLAAHVLAALVLGWFLRQGERALWSAARRAGVSAVIAVIDRLLAVLRLAPVVDSDRRTCATGVPPQQTPRAPHLCVVCGAGPVWRGPPAAIAPAA
jgi:hypothetical protein